MSEESKWHGQARQDEFVAAVLDEMRGGTFVDIGAGHPVDGSNTYALEKRYAWNGILCDIEHAPALRVMRDPINTVIANAFDPSMTAHIHALALPNAGRIEYLSLDIEPPIDTLRALVTLPLDAVRFSVITCEHDYYRMPASIKYAMAGILEGYGYVRVAEDVTMLAEGDGEKLFAVPVEDWWVDPRVIDVRKARALAREVNHKVEAAIVIALKEHA